MPRPVTPDEFETWNEEMIRRFDPDDYHQHPSPVVRFVERRRVATILRQLDVRPGQRVLEVGCGAGNILEQIDDASLYGIDISDYILEKARKRLNGRAQLLKGDAENLPFENHFFDRVFCSEVLEHVLHPDRVLSEMHRVVKPAGVVVVSVPNERLINRVKDVLFRVRPLARLLLQEEKPGYHSAERMDDEWHLHAFDARMLRGLAEDSFHIDRLQGVPSRTLPLRYVARLVAVPKESKPE